MIALEMRRAGMSALMEDVGRHFAAQASLDGKQSDLEIVVPQETFSVPWQGWRIAIDPSDQERDVELLISAMMAADLEVVCHGYYIPARD